MNESSVERIPLAEFPAARAGRQACPSERRRVVRRGFAADFLDLDNVFLAAQNRTGSTRCQAVSPLRIIPSDVVAEAVSKRSSGHGRVMGHMGTSSPFAAKRSSVLIAYDHPTMLQTVAGVLSSHFKIVAGVSDGAAAIELAAKTNPALIVLDGAMRGLDGLGTARELAQQKSPAKIVLLTAQDDDDYISDALSVGARGCVIKQRFNWDLIPALNLALNDQFFISPHAFCGNAKPETNGHVLQFYSSDVRFFQHAAELTYTALNNKELVFMFLSATGIAFVRQELRRRGFNYLAAIRRGQYWVLSIERALISSEETWPDASYFYSSVRACLNRAAAISQKSGRRLTIFSDLMSTVLRQGQGHEIAARIEAIWNELIPKHPCSVYCGCPAVFLGSRASREALSKVCAEHSNVIAIDR